jgi:uncharacterized protein (TIGR02246 family)
VRAVAKPGAAQVDQLEVRLVNERRGVQRRARILVPKAIMGDSAQVLVDERDELVQRVSVSLAPALEQLRNVGTQVDDFKGDGREPFCGPLTPNRQTQFGRFPASLAHWEDRMVQTYLPTARRSMIPFVLSLAVAVAACGDGTVASTDPRASSAVASNGVSASDAIDDLVAGATAAWSAKDPAAYASAYAEDAVFIGPTAVTLKGREAIRAQHAFLFTGPFAGSTQTITVTRVEYLTGTIAIVDQSVDLTGYAFLPPNGLKPTVPGVVRTIVRWVVEKRGGTWEIVAQQMTLVPPVS